jgi:UDP-3-O-[3-hydroxymyristoyl] glucosamine N-acyltransferase
MNNKKIKTISELAKMVGGEVSGHLDVQIYNLSELKKAKEGDISFLADRNLMDDALASEASALIVPLDFNLNRVLIKVKDPYWAAAVIQNFFHEKEFEATGISDKASVGKDCLIDPGVSIAPMVVIGDRVEIGKNVTIHPGVVIGDDVIIGDNTVIYANVTVNWGSSIGKRVFIHSGTVIGSDGFGYATGPDGRHVKRLQLGKVVIEDDVELGSNVSVDRATFGETIIKKGAKIDNLVQVAHNVIIGEGSILVGQSGVAGSSSLGKGVMVGGQAAISGHLTIGDYVKVAAKSGVTRDQPEKITVSGMPAIPHSSWLRAITSLPRIPELIKDVRRLKKKLNLT